MGGRERERERERETVCRDETSQHTHLDLPRTDNINPLCHGGQASAPKAAARIGKWKLLAYCYNVRGIDGATSTGPFLPRKEGVAAQGWPFERATALIDLEQDPGETKDVSCLCGERRQYS